MDAIAREAGVDWRRLSLVTDFVLDDLPDRGEAEVRLRHAVAAVATELLENAVKYTARPEDRVRLRISSYRGTICVESRNTAKRPSVDALQKIFETLGTDDPAAMLVRQLEFTATVQPESSGVGLIKLRADSNVGLGALIEAMDAEHAVVRLRAVLSTRGAPR